MGASSSEPREEESEESPGTSTSVLSRRPKFYLSRQLETILHGVCPMLLYRTKRITLVEEDGRHYILPDLSWDQLFNHEDLPRYLRSVMDAEAPLDEAFDLLHGDILPPLEEQEVWAAGVTYFRSRDARMEEAADSGGSYFYDLVYDADRPELFFKATAHRVAGQGENIRIRRDSKWNVPEPELTLAINARGEIVGYTVGNDVSSRDIEGANPLYLPQAKVYDRSCALGPGILVRENQDLPEETEIHLKVLRNAKTVFEGACALDSMKRKPRELVEYLYRESSFPHGCLLMTGTGVVPDSDFTLTAGDEVQITIEAIGTLVNTVR